MNTYVNPLLRFFVCTAPRAARSVHGRGAAIIHEAYANGKLRHD